MHDAESSDILLASGMFGSGYLKSVFIYHSVTSMSTGSA